MRIRSVPLLLVAAVLGCQDSVGPDSSVRVTVTTLTVPASIASGATLPVEVRFTMDACWTVTTVRATKRAAVVDVEVRGSRMDLSPGTGCLAVMVPRDSLLLVAGLPDGAFEVRGLQPRAPHIVLPLRVGP